MAARYDTRWRLEVQGYEGFSDRQLTPVEPWLRWSPALCTSIIAIGVVLGSPLILWGLVPFALAGALMRRHPFDYVYNLGVRRLTGTPPLPEHGAPRRFACGMAAVWMAVTAAAFAAGADTVGYTLGGMLIAVGGLVSVTHFCIPSMVFRFVFRRPVCEKPAQIS